VKIAEFLERGQVFTIALSTHAAGTAWNGQSGAYATLLDHDERGILIAPHEATTDEQLPAVFVAWSDVHAIRRHNPAQERVYIDSQTVQDMVSVPCRWAVLSFSGRRSVG
jgi:hypothetical protein